MFGGVGGRRRTEKDPVTERADSLSSSPPPPDRRRRGGTSEDDDVVYDFYDDDETTKKTMETQMEKMKRKMHLLQQELRAKDDMLEAVQSQAKLDIVNARTRVDSIEEKREELEARCAKAEKLALERTNALETANKKVKEAERSAKVFMQRANAKISEALRENSSNTISKDAAENRELKNASSSSPSKIERKLTPSNLSLQEKILRIEERQQMEDEEGLMSIHNNNNNTATTTTSSSSPLAANDNRVIKQNEEDKEEDKSNKEQTDMNQKQIEESLRNEIQQLLTQNADAARSFQDSLEIERNKRREAEERAEMSEAACVRLQSELRSKESLLKMMETTRSTGDKSETTALRARILNDEVEANATSASPPTTAKIEQVLQKIQRPRRKEGKEEESDDDDNDDDDDDEIPSFSPVKSPPPPPRKY